MTNLKLDNTTISVLKSFSLINPSMVFKEGSTVSTVSPTKTIMARAKVPVKFDRRFAIYNLSRFLNTIGMFNDPKLNIQDKIVKISDASGTKDVNYTLADENMIPVPATKEPSFPEGEIKFSLTIESLKEVEKALSILSLPELAIVGDGSKISIQAVDTKNLSGDIYKIDVGESDKVFTVIFKPENMSVLSKNLTSKYDVEISSKGFSHFKAENLEYWIAIESTSKFN